MSSSTGFTVVSIFLEFEAPLGCWDVQLNPLKTIADLHLPGRMGRVVKYQDVSVGLDSFFAFSNGDSCLLLVFSGLMFSSVANTNSLLLITPLEVLSFSCG